MLEAKIVPEASKEKPIIEGENSSEEDESSPENDSEYVTISQERGDIERSRRK